jgi:hypothetical protein
LARIVQWYLDISTDARGELFTVCIIVGAIILPQVLSVLISGLFGCGTPPILVSAVSNAAIFSIIKFFCFLSALIMGQQLYRIYGYPGGVGFLNIFGLDYDIGKSLILLAAAFGISAIYYNLCSNFNYITNKNARESFARIWHYMTRFTSSHDIWRAATLMLKRYGDKALEQSRTRIEELAADGDRDGANTWRRITTAVEQLANNTPPGPPH